MAARALTDAERRGLVAAARAVLPRSYAPYSRFPVAAAVMDEAGRVFAGVNVENASFGLSICAERAAVFRAVAEGARRLVACAIVTPTAELTPPCGACRQVLLEFGPEMEILLARAEGDDLPARFRLPELLPRAFTTFTPGEAE